MRTERRQSYLRLLLAAFALTIAAVLAIWSYRSAASSLANLTVTPDQVRQNGSVTLVGTGFKPNETVAIWITYPDFRVFGVAEVQANADGNFNYPYVVDFLGATFSPTGKYTYTAHGKSSGREVYADLLVDIGRGAATSQGVVMRFERGRDRLGTVYVIRGENMGSKEELAFWLRLPDNSILDLGRGTTGPSGAFEYFLYTDGQPLGHYAFTARGLRSGLTGIIEFDVGATDRTRARGASSLRLRPTKDDQRSFAIFEGFGFAPDEVVSIWVTLPNGATRAIGDVKVDDDGTFVASLYLGETEPVGRRVYTAFGNSSRLRAIADYQLGPGGPQEFNDPAREGQFDVISPDQDKDGYPECFDAPAPAPGIDPCTGGYEPGAGPTTAPTTAPTAAPTTVPTAAPTTVPTAAPTAAPYPPPAYPAPVQAQQFVPPTQAGELPPVEEPPPAELPDRAPDF